MIDVELEHITRTFNKGTLKAVSDVSLAVDKGALFGLIGPDGAGKTTLFRILTTLLLPDSGVARISGRDVVTDYREIRKRVGYMPGKFSLYQDLTVEENLRFFATVFNTTIEANYDLIRDIYVLLEPFKNRRAGNLSGGMKQKLALSCALIHRPEVLFLDEPTTGVDAVSRREFWQMLQRLKQEGITILVSTPYMDEATLCERIALIQSGAILSVNTPNEIIANFPDHLYAIRSEHMGSLLGDLRRNQLVKTCNAFGEYHHITFNSDAPDSIPQLQQQLITAYPDLVIHETAPTIEDCFIHLMN